MCRYPGCHSTRHLKAHHVVPWILGGRTDLENLILLCQWHHTTVHEGGVTITRNGDGWVFRKPELAAVGSFQHPDAQTIRPRWTGEPFDLHACVQALFTIKLREHPKDLDQQAA
jgi:hypothetical protein